MIAVHTVGRSDFQVFDPSRNIRWPIEKNSVQKFSQFLADAPEQWTVAEGDVPESRSVLEWLPDLKCLAPPQSNLREVAGEFEFGGSYKPVLCCPLVRRFLKKLGDVSQLSHILILDTARDGREDEPTHVYEVIRRYLIEVARVDHFKIHRSTFITDGLLDQFDKFGQAVLRTECAIIIDNKLKGLAVESAAVAQRKIFINDVGGIPLVRSVLLASARYRFGFNNVYLARALETQPNEEPSDVIAPEDSLNDRRLAIDAIELGDFRGAARIALAARDETGHRIPGTFSQSTRASELEPWRAMVVISANALDGYFGGIDHIPANSRTRTALQDIATFGLTALPAIAAELALRRQDYPAAIFESRRFFETLEEILSYDRHNDWRMRRFWNQMQTAVEGGKHFWELRNITSHEQLTGKQIRDAIKIAESRDNPERAFWDLGSRFKFLLCPLTRPLCAKDDKEVHQLLDNLINGLRQDLDSFCYAP